MEDFSVVLGQRFEKTHPTTPCQPTWLESRVCAKPLVALLEELEDGVEEEAVLGALCRLQELAGGHRVHNANASDKPERPNTQGVPLEYKRFFN